ncbi:MAG: hypothetical protein IJO48_01585 [Clostridia bacterium]|nr:hypothetical protein [Clostridia bacterium]
MQTLFIVDSDNRTLIKRSFISPLSVVKDVISRPFTLYDVLGNSRLGWVDISLLNAFEQFEQSLSVHLDIQCAFTPYGSLSHAFGKAMHFSSLTMPIDKLRIEAMRSGLFSYIEPGFLSPTWVHAEIDSKPPPMLGPESYASEVIFLNQALSLEPLPLFTKKTEERLLKFQASHNIAKTGITDIQTWKFIKIGSD